MPELATTRERRVPAESTMRRAGILSIAAAVPPHVVPNEPIAERLGIDPQWIVERTGISERHVLGEGETLLDLAQSAAERALDAADLAGPELDQILVATVSHDRLTPALAPMLAARLHSNAGAMDVGAACTGFLSALALATAQIESRRADRILVVGAERLASHVDPDDRATAALFGDGAGAVVVGEAAGAGVGPFSMGSDGSLSELITAERDEAIIHMRGHDTFREAVDRMSQATLTAGQAADVEIDDIDHFVFHQANARILAALTRRLGLDPKRVAESISRFGNTSAASVPITLCDAADAGAIRSGDRVLLAAFGAGLTWGATIVEWEARGEC
jgi:3-oxoacyl-[acyl-carrier-protein] synthase III